jgi:hypothetical protein
MPPKAASLSMARSCSCTQVSAGTPSSSICTGDEI